MLGVSVSAFGCRQPNPPLSCCRKQREDFIGSDSQRQKRVVDQTWVAVETTEIRKAKRLTDNCLFSSSCSLGRVPSAAAGYHCLLQAQSPEKSIQLAKPRPSQAGRQQKENRPPWLAQWERHCTNSTQQRWFPCYCEARCWAPSKWHVQCAGVRARWL